MTDEEYEQAFPLSFLRRFEADGSVFRVEARRYWEGSACRSSACSPTRMGAARTGAAAHAVLARLRRHGDGAALFAAYAADAEADLRLIASLVPVGGRVERLWLVRDAAFCLRWRELGGA